MRLRSLLAPAFAFLLPIAACGVDDFEPVLAIKQKPPTARFTLGESGGPIPAFLDVPFPSDVYLKDGRFAALPGVERTFKRNGRFLSDQLARLNGWSRIAPVLFPIDDPRKPVDPETGEPATALVDRASLPADENECTSDKSSVFLIDLDTGKRIPCRAIVHDEEQVDGGRSLLAVGPARGVVLEEAHHYCAVVTSRVRDKEGRNIAPSDELLTAVEKKEGPLAPIYGAAYDKVKAALGGALGAERIVALSPYTTQQIVSETFALREALETSPAATLKWDAASMAPMGAVKFAAAPGGVLPAGFTASLDAWLGVVPQDKKLPDGSDDPDESLPVRAHDKIAAVGTAVFDAINYLQVRPAKYDDVDHATFARDASGKPIPAPEKPTSKIWVTIVVPTGAMPASGYPVVIAQHGLSSSRAYMMALANTFAKKGWMTVAIDSVTFGARANDPKFQVDTTSDWAKAPGATYDGPDGMADLVGDDVRKERAGSFDLFGGLKNILAMRDQVRQASFDTAQLVKVLRSNPDLSPLKTGADVPKIDPDKIAYVGDSLGAIEGATAAALEPHVKAWTLNVGGGGILQEIAAHGPVVNAQLSLAGSLNFGFVGGQYSEGHPVVALGQTLAEGGDPIAYADKIVLSPTPLAGAPTKPRNVFQIEVLYDELVANEGNEALARAGGWSMATPNVGLNAGVGDLASHAPYRGGGIVLPMVDPDASGFHDTPVAGVTAIVAQVSPATHGADLHRSKSNRQYRIPFNDDKGKLVVDRLANQFDAPCPYRELQDAMVRFFDDAFAGKVPVVSGLPAPVRDLDADGALDGADVAPADPASK